MCVCRTLARVNYEKPDPKESTAAKFGIPQHQGLVIHTDSLVYSVDRYEDAIHIHTRSPIQHQLWIEEGKKRSFFKGVYEVVESIKTNKKKVHVLVRFFKNNPAMLTIPYHLIFNNCIMATILIMSYFKWG